jgi:cyclophilin family peptidyl-prolyl cis-trans isomerase
VNKLYALIFGVCMTTALVPAHAQESTNENNTIVRFDFSTWGTNVGSIDIELFDQDKPETVKNFLLYIYSGQYSNLLVHRVDTNSVESVAVLQAGHILLPEPASAETFSGYRQGKNFGRITNETHSGPELSNVFGTIAAARLSGSTNSASTDWYFNLADNSVLDTNNGGYTVFGRVINTAGVNSGTNLLKFFATLTNLTYAFFGSGEGFNQLPFSTLNITYSTNDLVSTNITYTTNETVIVTNTVVATNIVISTNILPVRFQDLYTINASFVRGGLVPEKKKPQFKLTSPSPRVRVVTNDTITFGGLAKDDSRVERVVYDANFATEIIDGSVASDWSGTVTLKPGTNEFVFRSIDQFGNESKSFKRTVFYKVPVPISLSSHGAGTIIGATNQEMLDIGRNYTLFARPDRGNFFVRWTGTITNSFPVLTFTMRTGLVFNATFATNPFPRLRGTYFGIMSPRSTNDSYRVAGTIVLKLGPKGTYSGRIQALGATFPMRGVFSIANDSFISGTLGSKVLALTLAISTNGPAEMRGTYQNGDESADVQMYRLEKLGSPAPEAGEFTFAIAPQVPSANGDGFAVGTAQVTETGAVTMSGTLPNGVQFSQSTTLYSGEHVPLFTKWNSREALMGWVTFSTNHNSFEGIVRWLSDSFTNAFGEAGQVFGSRFVSPVGGAPVLDWTNGVVQLSGDDLQQGIEIPVALDGTTFVVGTNNVDLQLTTGTDGRVTGTFVHPGSQAVTPVNGVLIQENKLGVGFFPGTNRSGAIRIGVLTQ